MAKTEKMSWMRKGMRVTFAPPYGPGGETKATYTGRLACEPFLMGAPQNDRWVVHIEDMDKTYIDLFGRHVHTCAPVEYVTPLKGV